MLAITYTSVEEQPTYTGRIESWDFAPAFGPATFTASIPDGIEEIDFTTPEDEVRRLEQALADYRKEH